MLCAAGLLFLTAPGVGQAPDTPVTSSGDIRFYVDHAGFLGREGKTYQEIYLMLYADQLHYTQQAGAVTAVFEVTLLLEDEQTGARQQHVWITEAVVATDSADVGKLAIYDQWVGELQPGKYKMTVTVADVHSSAWGRASEFLVVIDLSGPGVTASQIEFVARAEAGAAEGHFAKNHRTVVPNPARRYGILNSVLYFYYELYNLPNSAGSVLTADYTLRQLSGEFVKNLPARQIEQPGTSASVLHGFDVSRLPGGIYDLTVRISDASGSQLLHFSRNFEIIQADYFAAQPVLSEAGAKTAGQMLRHIAVQSELRVYENLNLHGKAQFLVRFWRERDPTPETVENEYLQQVHRRFVYANEHFGWGRTEGWQSDRGRVLIQNGMPDEIIRYANEPDSNPYEIWVYRRDRSYQFIFGDTRADGRYVLLHSNKEDEVHNPHWNELLKQN